jgi:hypothetical protein
MCAEEGKSDVVAERNHFRYSREESNHYKPHLSEAQSQSEKSGRVESGC